MNIEKKNFTVLAITTNYPSDNKPNEGVFFKENLLALKNSGCTIIVLVLRTVWRRKIFFFSVSENSDFFIIEQPYISFSNKQTPIGNTIRLSDACASIQAVSALKKIKSNIRIDLVYAKFFSMGLVAQKIAKKMKIPCFVSIGESNLDKYNSFYPIDFLKNKFNGFTKIETVSDKLKKKIHNHFDISYNRIVHIPNGVNRRKFTPGDQVAARKLLGLSKGDFIVAYTGWMSERKGAMRLAKAIEQIKKPNIKAIYMGDGSDHPNGNHVIYKGKVPHNEMPTYLQAADVFCLPTLEEGMPNATLEAMACGLPIITSDLDFNREFLSSQNAILIDPRNIDSLSKAIKNLYSNSLLRKELSKAAHKTIQNYDIKDRADKIIRMFLN
jgi:teichuronic acid biosynthesis glycosyltransferase TuaC